MPGDDKLLGVARIYAEALLGLADRRGESERVLDELEELARFGAEHPALSADLLSPLADAAHRRTSLEKMFRGRASDLLVDALQVLNRRNRLGLLSSIATAYRAAFQRARKVLDVRVRTAAPLGEAERERIRAGVAAHTGQRARLIEQVEPELLGGLVVQVGDDKYDASVRNQLERLHGQLLERATREIIEARGRVSRG